MGRSAWAPAPPTKTKRKKEKHQKFAEKYFSQK